jgi:uncharacterized lipoprotein YmbA
MKLPLVFLALGILLSGCIIFDKKSEAVTFYQLSHPVAAAKPPASGRTVFIPRAVVPSALRRPNIVLLDDTGWVRIEDAHRWIAPLDRTIPETVARHLTAATGFATALQVPAEEHLVLLLTLEKMEVFAPASASRTLFTLPGMANPDTAVLVISYRLEKSDGTLVAAKTYTQSRPLKGRTPTEFVQAQSANLADFATELAQGLRSAPPSP